MRQSLERFFARATVIELTAAVAVGLAAIHLMEEIVTGLIIRPIQLGRIESAPPGTGYVKIAGRVFDWIDPLGALLVLVLVLALLGRYLRSRPETLDDDDRTLECPHCLSAIPERAAVCCYCTRDVGPSAAALRAGSDPLS